MKNTSATSSTISFSDSAVTIITGLAHAFHVMYNQNRHLLRIYHLLLPPQGILFQSPGLKFYSGSFYIPRNFATGVLIFSFMPDCFKKASNSRDAYRVLFNCLTMQRSGFDLYIKPHFTRKAAANRLPELLRLEFFVFLSQTRNMKQENPGRWLPYTACSF